MICCSVCAKLGFPIADHKLEGPATTISFLGISINAAQGVLRLPQEKLSRLKSLILSWLQKKSCHKRELLSLIVQLQHACRVVHSGCSFLRRMIDLSAVPKELHHWVRLNQHFRSDLQWWAVFLEDWNEVSLFGGMVRTPSQFTVTLDASGHWGCGVFTEAGHWFQSQWSPVWAKVHITAKELLPMFCCMRRMGKTVLSMRQCSSCGYTEIQDITELLSDASGAVSVLFHCSEFITTPLTREGQQSGRPPL